MKSSYFGDGDWALEDKKLTLYDKGTGTIRKAVFDERNGDLIYIQQESDCIDAWEHAQDEQNPIRVSIKYYDDKKIWESELGIKQTAWKAFYLYSEGKLNYVMEYIPKESQGQSTYTFRMFTFDEDGNQIVKLEAFDADVSEYLKKAEILVSTIGGEVRYK